MNGYETIQVDLTDSVMTIMLNRPDSLNAYTPQMGVELLEAFDAADENDDVRVVLIVGAGHAFCVGADISGGGGRFVYPADREHEDPGGMLTLRMFALLKPTIVAFNGAAAGIGVTLSLAADIRMSSSAARFAFGFTRIGVVPEAASAWFLPRIVGLPQAIEWTITGRRFDAEEALRGGLVRSIHDPGELLPAARALAAEIVADTAPVSVALTRQMMWRAAGEPHPMSAHRIASKAMFSRGQARDVSAGIEAFLTKTAPEFPDRVSSDLPESYPWWPIEPFAG